MTGSERRGILTLRARPRRRGVAWRDGLLGLLFLPAVLTSGCGLGAGPAPSAVHLTVTRDFGASVVRSWSAPQVRGQETVMSLLMRNATVTTRYGGVFLPVELKIA